MQFLASTHFNKYCKRNFPITQNICDYGFTYMKPEATAQNISLNNYSQNL